MMNDFAIQPIQAVDTALDGGAAQGRVRTVLRLEALLALVASLFAFHHWGQSLGWTGFAALFLLPDLAMLAYFAGPRAGAVAYNITHSTIGPILLLGSSVAFSRFGLALSLVWIAHIAFDRSLGYGLKYARGFEATHLGRLKWTGKGSAQARSAATPA
jgi:hypothetical protein